MNSSDEVYIDKKALDVSFLFITANEHEETEFLSRIVYLDRDGKKTKINGRNMNYNVGIFGKYLVAHAHCREQGSGKDGASYSTVNEAYNELKPKGVIMIGIGYGVSEEVDNLQKIGDIMISHAVQGCNYEKIQNDPEGKVSELDRDKKYFPSNFIKNAFSSFSSRHSFSKHQGVILSKEHLINHKEYKESLIKKHESASSLKTGTNRTQLPIWKEDNNLKIIGGEMEGVGLAAAMKDNGNDNWIIVKGICDWAWDKENLKEERQKLAAKNSTAFCYELFMKDNLNKITGVVQAPQKYQKIREQTEDIINKYAMFYYRNKHRISFKRLSNVTRISERVLRKIEHEGTPHYALERLKAEKIDSFLDAGGDILSSKVSDFMKEFYNHNKGKHMFVPVANMKAVVFDFDGTLTKRTQDLTTWEQIWIDLGYPQARCISFHRKFVKKEIDHNKWCDITSQHFIEKKLTKDKVIDIAKKIELCNGVKELLYTLKGQVDMYICSGSIDTVIYSVLKDLTSFFTEIKCNSFVYDSSGNFAHIVGTDYDFEGKPKFIRESLILEKGYKPNEILFVGNSFNDEFVHKSRVGTLVVNPHMTIPYDRKKWNYFPGNCNNMMSILPYILPEKYAINSPIVTEGEKQ